MIRKIDNLPDQLLHGDKIAALCDVEINSPTSRNTDKLGDCNQIIFCKTDLLDSTFQTLHRFNADRKFILFTHNSDYVIDDTRWNARPSCVKLWIAENVVIMRDRLWAIPLGIERPNGKGYSFDTTVIESVWSQEVKIRNIVFMCHNDKTNQTAREPVTNLFKNKSWVTWKPYGISFQDFCENVHHHKFVVCPEGNGPDTHRLWETLALGSIPILKKSIFSEHWKDLPVLIVNDWNEITEDYLEDVYTRIQGREWNMSIMTMNYWHALIQTLRRDL